MNSKHDVALNCVYIISFTFMEFLTFRPLEYFPVEQPYTEGFYEKHASCLYYNHGI